MQVVDEQHQGATLGQAPQQFTQGGQAAPPDFLWVGNRAAAPGGADDCLEAAQDRKDPGQRPNVAGQ